MSEKQLNSEQADLEARLGALIPAAPRLDRDQIMYSAGIQAAKRRTRIFQCWGFAATAALVIVSVGLASKMTIQPEPQIVERIVYRNSPPTHVQNPPEQEFQTVRVWTRQERMNRFQPERASQACMTPRGMVFQEITEIPPEEDSEIAPQPSLKSGSRKAMNELLGS